jgi:hypothetical protein
MHKPQRQSGLDREDCYERQPGRELAETARAYRLAVRCRRRVCRYLGTGHHRGRRLAGHVERGGQVEEQCEGAGITLGRTGRKVSGRAADSGQDSGVLGGIRDGQGGAIW